MSLEDRFTALREIGKIIDAKKIAFMDPPGDPWDLDEDTEKIDISEDLAKAIEEERGYKWNPMKWLDPVCECGVAKTYGKDVAKEFHSTWCNLRKR